MADKNHYVRDDVRGFLAMLEQMNAPLLQDMSPADARGSMLAMGQLAESAPRDLAVIKDVTCPGPAGDIPLRFYDTKETREAGPVVLFMHGGGFVIGDLEVYHALCTEISTQLDLPVLSVDYRLAPEAPFPAAPEDCEAAARWLATSPAELGREVTGLIPMGDSAGGNLTIVVTNQLCANPAAVPVVVQVPIYPVADDPSQHKSFHEFGGDYMLTIGTMKYFTDHYAADPADSRNSPMVADCSNTPPTVLCTAGLDPLRDSGRTYASHLIQQGTDVAYLEFAGNIHGFTTLRKAIPSGQQDLDALMAATKLMVERHG